MQQKPIVLHFYCHAETSTRFALYAYCHVRRNEGLGYPQPGR